MTHQNAPKHTHTHQTLISRNYQGETVGLIPPNSKKELLIGLQTKKHVVQRNKKDQMVILQPPKKVSWIAACDGISRAQYLLEVYLDSHPS